MSTFRFTPAMKVWLVEEYLRGIDITPHMGYHHISSEEFQCWLIRYKAIESATLKFKELSRYRAILSDRSPPKALPKRKQPKPHPPRTSLLPETLPALL